MKRQSIAGAFFFLFFMPLNLLAASLHYNAGTYDLSGSFSIWNENFPAGEGQANPLNLMNATGFDDTGFLQWTLTASIVQSAQETTEQGYGWKTIYNVIIEYTASNPTGWGSAFTLSGVPAMNLSKRTNYTNIQDLAFQFTTVGYVFDSDGNQYRMDISAIFDGSVADRNYAYDAEQKKHMGIGFDEVTLKVSQVPLPAAAWLLGTGLIGLAVIRKKRSN
jgi:hypothetical protein